MAQKRERFFTVNAKMVAANNFTLGLRQPGQTFNQCMEANSGQVSAFGFGGLQVGWNGGSSGSIYTGFVYGLNNSNSNYLGGFTGLNGGAGAGVFAASSSGGLTGGTSGLAPNGAVKVGGVSVGASLIPGPTGGAAATNYTKPLRLGKFWAFAPIDVALYAARQACK